MTDHPKPIARYEVRDVNGDDGVVDTDLGGVYLAKNRPHAVRIAQALNDHEAALAAERTKWRTAIEAKAREWKRKGNLKNWQTDPLKEGAAIAWDAAASDLLALLEKKP